METFSFDHIQGSRTVTKSISKLKRSVIQYVCVWRWRWRYRLAPMNHSHYVSHLLIDTWRESFTGEDSLRVTAVHQLKLSIRIQMHFKLHTNGLKSEFCGMPFVTRKRRHTLRRCACWEFAYFLSTIKTLMSDPHKPRTTLCTSVGRYERR